MTEHMNYYRGNQTGGLTPITSEWMTRLFENQETVRELVVKHGSPINLHHLPTFTNNIGSFKKVFASYGLKYQIFYARKANKCKFLVKQALASGIGVDVASYKELKQSLDLGGHGESLVLTSAIKTDGQVELAICNEVPIILDNRDECLQTQALATSMGQSAKVGIRISGFTVDGKKLYSRFGFDISNVAQFIISYLGHGKVFDKLSVVGLHFHLDGYSTIQRAKALSDCIALAKSLREKGYPINFIDIGGGILMNYLQSEKQWNEFIFNLKSDVKENRSDLTFNGDGLGFTMVAGELHGKLNTYPFYNKIHGEAFIRQIMDFNDPNGAGSNAQRLVDLNIEVRIEPGRSLLNQVGMTIAKVAHRKEDAMGRWLVGLEMNMSQMMSSSADFLLDPYIMSSSLNEVEKEVGVFMTGAYCLERDILLKRKIKLPKLPEIGDLVAFVNTAGYMMHFFETEAHLFELSKNLVFFDTVEVPTVLDFILDEQIDEVAESAP